MTKQSGEAMFGDENNQQRKRAFETVPDSL
jgi:hypothetical protein